MTLLHAIFGLLSGRYDHERFWRIRDKLVSGRCGLMRYYYHWRYQQTLNRFNAFIPLSASFESRPVLPHGISGIHISHGARLGRNCVIFQQVTIGSNALPGSRLRGSPAIGDDCYIGCGAAIIGNVRIGNRVRIGANCVVVEDIPDNSTVVMQKPRVIANSEPNDNRFIPHRE